MCCITSYHATEAQNVCEKSYTGSLISMWVSCCSNILWHTCVFKLLNCFRCLCEFESFLLLNYAKISRTEGDKQKSRQPFNVVNTEKKVLIMPLSSRHDVEQLYCRNLWWGSCCTEGVIQQWDTLNLSVWKHVYITGLSRTRVTLWLPNQNNMIEPWPSHFSDLKTSYINLSHF